jgi:hypothetical protein
MTEKNAPRKMTQYHGCDELREWLLLNGFRVSIDSFRTNEVCNWYAYRKTKIDAPECEFNDGKGTQIVVRPHVFNHDAEKFERAEIDITGEAGGIWYKLTAYSLKPADVMGGLDKIEASLVAAWTALTR